jgi:hypothetical protein
LRRIPAAIVLCSPIKVMDRRWSWLPISIVRPADYRGMKDFEMRAQRSPA